MNFEKNKNYFRDASKISILGVFLGCIIGLVAIKANLTFGIIVFALLAAYIFNKGRKKVDDTFIDAEYKKGINDIVNKGLAKLGIVEDEVKLIDPIVINGPFYANISRGYYSKKGKDNRWRSSNYEVAVLYFSELQVYVYKFRFSIVNDETNESTDEYFYRDIVSVSTSSNSIKNNQNKTLNLEHFKLTTSGGTSISCSIWDMGQVEKSIKGMKQLLRDKKSA